LSQSAIKLDQLIASLLSERQAAGQLRQSRTVRPLDATHIEVTGRQCVNFCSNNYLGPNRHPRLLAAAEGAMRKAGFGSGAAALICGQTEFHSSAERALARWKKTPSAVLLPSGYQANHAAVQTFSAIAQRTGSGLPLRFLLDKLVHASILDAVFALDKRSVRIFPHNNLAKLARLLRESDNETLNVVITESIFSMDGDAADLRGLADLKKEFPFALMLDEAHATGVYGPDGSGYAAELGLENCVDVSIVTLSKALGGIGGAICASEQFCQAVLNFGRAMIYTTSLPPAAAAAAEAAIEVLRDEPQRRTRLREISARARSELSNAGVKILPGDSPIICVVLGSEQAALHAAEELFKAGLLVAAVRPPTVPPASSRLRMTLACDHTDDEIRRLIAAVAMASRVAIRP
jgi:8-amino-7-oxononanoate synthase